MIDEYEHFMSAKGESDAADAELLSVFEDTDDPVLTAVEVGERLGITQQAAHSRLSRAHKRGEVERKKVGSRAVVWWTPGQFPPSESL